MPCVPNSDQESLCGMWLKPRRHILELVASPMPAGRVVPDGGQEFVENTYPLPFSNRKGLAIGIDVREVSGWRYQVCCKDYNQADFLRHQFSQRHLTHVQGQMQELPQDV